MTLKNKAAVTLGKLGGRAKSDAKTAAARRNAKKGGWPKGKARTSQVFKLRGGVLMREQTQTDVWERVKEVEARCNVAVPYPIGVSDIRHDGSPVYHQIGDPIDDVRTLLSALSTLRAEQTRLREALKECIAELKVSSQRVDIYLDAEAALSSTPTPEPPTP